MADGMSPNQIGATEIRRRRVAVNAPSMGSMLFWAVGFPAVEYLLQSWDPLALISVRLAIAVAMLVALWALLERPRALLKAQWWRGLFAFGCAKADRSDDRGADCLGDADCGDIDRGGASRAPVEQVFCLGAWSAGSGGRCGHECGGAGGSGAGGCGGGA